MNSVRFVFFPKKMNRGNYRNKKKYIVINTLRVSFFLKKFDNLFYLEVKGLLN